MKNSIKKFFAVCAAVTAISAVSAVAVNAAGEITAEPVDASTVTVKQVSGTAVSGETTILLLKGDYVNDKTTVVDDDILYINQDDAATATATGGFLADAGVLPKEDLVSGQVYTARVADQTGAFMYQTTFTYGSDSGNPYATSSRLIGDVDGDTIIALKDATPVLYHAINVKQLTGEDLQAADTDDNGVLGLSDATPILYKAINANSVIDGVKTIAEKANYVAE